MDGWMDGWITLYIPRNQRKLLINQKAKWLRKQEKSEHIHISIHRLCASIHSQYWAIFPFVPSHFSLKRRFNWCIFLRSGNPLKHFVVNPDYCSTMWFVNKKMHCLLYIFVLQGKNHWNFQFAEQGDILKAMYPFSLICLQSRDYDSFFLQCQGMQSYDSCVQRETSSSITLLPTGTIKVQVKSCAW